MHPWYASYLQFRSDIYVLVFVHVAIKTHYVQFMWIIPRVHNSKSVQLPLGWYDVGNQWWICPYMYIGCVNSVVNHNFTLTRAHLLLQCLHSLCTYMDILTTYCRDGGSGNPMAVAYSHEIILYFHWLIICTSRQLAAYATSVWLLVVKHIPQKIN